MAFTALARRMVREFERRRACPGSCGGRESRGPSRTAGVGRVVPAGAGFAADRPFRSPGFSRLSSRSARFPRVCAMTARSATPAVGQRFRPPADLSLHPFGARERAARVGGCRPAARRQPRFAGRHAGAATPPDRFCGCGAAFWGCAALPHTRSGRPAAHPLSHHGGEGITTVVNHRCGEALTEAVIPAFAAEIPDSPCVPPPDSHVFSPDSLSLPRGLWRSLCERIST